MTFNVTLDWLFAGNCICLGYGLLHLYESFNRILDSLFYAVRFSSETFASFLFSMIITATAMANIYYGGTINV